MKKYDLYGGFFWLAIAVGVGALAIKLGLGTIRKPGPGLFPFLICLILALFSSCLIYATVRERNRIAINEERPSFNRNVFLILAAILLYALALEILGYIIASFILFLYLYKSHAGKHWRTSIFITMVVVFVTYYLFAVILNSQIPKGFLTWL
jgi:putative tricarboxylic transport membrane protein